MTALPSAIEVGFSTLAACDPARAAALRLPVEGAESKPVGALGARCDYGRVAGMACRTPVTATVRTLRDDGSVAEARPCCADHVRDMTRSSSGIRFEVVPAGAAA